MPRSLDAARRALVLAGLTAACGLAADARAQAPAAPAAAAAASTPFGAVSPLQPGAQWHFAAPRGAAPAIGPQVLSEEERRFLAGLPEVRVGLALPAFRPYERLADNGEVSGVHPEMLAGLARAFGVRLRPVVFDSWPSVIKAAEAREVDLLMSVGVSTARARFMAFTLGATPMVTAVFARKGDATVAATGRWAVVRGNMAVEHVGRLHPAARLIEVQDSADGLAAVAAGRADFYVGVLLPTLERLASTPMPGIEVQRLLDIGSGYYHFAVRKDWAPLARILNRGIANVRQEPSAELAAALRTLPASMAAPGARALGEEHTAALVERSSWRIGAVRGLSLLNEIDAQGRHTGIGADMAEAVARQLGVGLEVVAFDSVAQMLDALRAEQIDVVPFLTRTPQRAREFSYTAPYVSMPYMLVARRDAPLYWDLGSLAGKRLALAPQHPLRELVAERYPQVRIVEAGSGAAAMDAVASGLADAAVEVKLFANLRINADNDGVLRVLGPVDELPAQFHFATSQRARALVPIIDEALAAMPAVERSRIERRWLAQDLAPQFPWKRWAPTLAAAATGLALLLATTAWWLWRLKREVSARRRSDEHLQDIGATIPGLAFRSRFGPDGQFRGAWYSPGSAAFMGLPLDAAQALMPQFVPRLMPEDRELAQQVHAQALQLGQRVKATVRYNHPDGRLRWMLVEVIPKPLPGGGVTLTGYMVDVSVERELQARVLQEADARHLLLASASHELRAPTHSLSLALQALAAEAPGTENPHLKVARESARTLTQLLNDVLDAARLDHGELPLHPQAFALRTLIDEIAGSHRTWARDKRLAFEVEVDPALPRVVQLDPMRLRQVIVNLLSNAIKYTDAGGVRLAARRHAAPDGDASAWLAIEVDDTGRGIAPEQMQRLYTPYAAAGAGTAVGSTGLGLSICRRLVERMGGRIELHSEPGQGSRLRVLLPLPPLRSGERRGTVLVCDDDPTSRLLMAQMLALRGHAVAQAADGAEALARWRAGDVCAVITDLEMEGMPGLELIRRLRELEGDVPPPERTRIVVCSGSAVPLTGLSGAPHDAYLSKPVELDVLAETLGAIGVLPAGAAASTTADRSA